MVQVEETEATALLSCPARPVFFFIPQKLHTVVPLAPMGRAFFFGGLEGSPNIHFRSADSMQEERKYKQAGYQDSRPDKPRENGGKAGFRPVGERFAPPRHVMDVVAPRTPRLVESVTATRCYDCGCTLPAGFDFAEPCPKCSAAVHCCKQCAHFDTGAHFQCTQPIPERISIKHAANECALFRPRVTVSRDAVPAPPVKTADPAPERTGNRSVDAARAAFENLFKK